MVSILRFHSFVSFNHVLYFKYIDFSILGFFAPCISFAYYNSKSIDVFFKSVNSYKTI